MEFQRWTDEYETAVDNWFSELASEPAGYQIFAEAMQEAIEDFSDKFKLPEMRCVIAFYDLKEFKKRYESDYPSKFAYRNAFSMTTELSDLDQNTVFMAVHPDFPDRADNWKGIVKYDTLHELAHQIYFEKTEMDLMTPAWKKMIFEGHAMFIAEKIASEKGYGVDYPFLEMPEVELQEVLDDLDGIIGGRDDNSKELSQLFSYGGEKFTGAEGYPLAFNVVRHLVESGHELDELMKMEDEDKRQAVRESLSALLD